MNYFLKQSIAQAITGLGDTLLALHERDYPRAQNRLISVQAVIDHAVEAFSKLLEELDKE